MTSFVTVPFYALLTVTLAFGTAADTTSKENVSTTLQLKSDQSPSPAPLVPSDTV